VLSQLIGDRESVIYQDTPRIIGCGTD